MIMVVDDKIPGMAKEVNLNYVYMDPVTQERFDLACDELGWLYKQLVKNCLQAFFRVNKDFYIGCGLADCEARGMKETEYYQLLRDEGEEALKPYSGDRPIFGPSPLDKVPSVPNNPENRRRYSGITLGGYNLVLLRIAQIVSRESLVGLVSLIVKQHFSDYWEGTYLPQIYLDKECKLKG